MVNEIKKVIVGILKKDAKILIAQRAKKDSSYGKWEFPGGKLEAGETEQECLKRELFEEFSIQAEIGEYFGRSYFEYNEFSYELRAYLVDTFSGEFVLQAHEQIKWVSKNELANYDVPDADKPIIKKLIAENFES